MAAIRFNRADMQVKRLCIEICASFSGEAAIITESGDFADVAVVAYPNRCGRPALTWDEIRQAAAPPEQYDSIHIFGGCCLAGLGAPPHDLAHCRVMRFEYCMEMIAGNLTVRSLVADGAYMVTPGWLMEWRQHVMEWGFTEETAKEFFAECSRQVVLFDTGIHMDSAREIAAFSRFIDRPCTIVPIGLDLMRLRMQLCREQWISARTRYAEQQAQRQFSDYAMAFDLLSTLVSSVDEIDVTKQVTNLYQMLFAATDAAFISFEDGRPTTVSWVGFGAHVDDDETCNEACALCSDYSLLPAGDGFLLRVRHGERNLGVVKVVGIALPEHVDSYLNLALATIGVCALAINNARTFKEIADKNSELAKAHTELQNTHMQMLQQEKMASIGQLAAGVAHEINNPMGFITSNLGTLNKYFAKLLEYMGAADQVIANSAVPEKEEAHALRSRLKLDYVVKDTQQLIEESLDGALRVKKIVNDLKNLSRSDSTELVSVDLNACIDSSLNIACNEIKYKADIIRQFGKFPALGGHPQQLSQVFINLFTNAGQAIEGHGAITIRTWSDEEWGYVSVADTGAGMPAEIQHRIFEPFFTTKDVGKGTGLGLSISYDIIKKHGGDITVESAVGRGTTFLVRLPLSRPEQPA